MKKEILITLCCTSLMLVTPLTGVAQENKISSNLTGEPEIEDDCEICPKVSNQYLLLIGSLINRLEIFEKKVEVLSRYKPEFEEKYLELSKRISTIQGLNIGDDFCTILGIILVITLSIIGISFCKELIIFEIFLDITFGTIFSFTLLVWGKFCFEEYPYKVV